MLETIKLYRAVCEAEFQQLKATGRFESVPGSLEGKWFAETLEGARKWGDWFSIVSGARHERIIEIEIDREIADRLVRFANLDGCGSARYAELDQLTGAIVREAQR
jgi:hypothetical protein